MTVEPLTAQERDAFIAEAKRLGPTIVASMLDVRGVRRFSYLGKFDRAAMLVDMKRARK